MNFEVIFPSLRTRTSPGATVSAFSEPPSGEDLCFLNSSNKVAWSSLLERFLRGVEYPQGRKMPTAGSNLPHLDDLMRLCQTLARYGAILTLEVQPTHTV